MTAQDHIRIADNIEAQPLEAGHMYAWFADQPESSSKVSQADFIAVVAILQNRGRSVRVEYSELVPGGVGATIQLMRPGA